MLLLKPPVSVTAAVSVSGRCTGWRCTGSRPQLETK